MPPTVAGLRAYLEQLLHGTAPENAELITHFFDEISTPGFREGNRLLVSMAIDVQSGLLANQLDALCEIIVEAVEKSRTPCLLRTVDCHSVLHCFGQLANQRFQINCALCPSAPARNLRKVAHIFTYCDYYAPRIVGSQYNKPMNHQAEQRDIHTRRLRKAKIVERNDYDAFGKRDGGVTFVTNSDEIERWNHLTPSERVSTIVNGLGLGVNYLKSGGEFVLFHFEGEFSQPCYQPNVLTCASWEYYIDDQMYTIGSPFWLASPPDPDGWGLTFPTNGDTNHAFKEKIFWNFTTAQKPFTLKIEYLDVLETDIDYETHSLDIINEGLVRFAQIPLQ